MKITIDTKQNTPEEIKKAIEFLQTLIGEPSSIPSSIPSSESDMNVADLSMLDPEKKDDDEPESSQIVTY